MTVPLSALAIRIKLKHANLDLAIIYQSRNHTVIEPLLLGIVLGLIPVTLAGLFVAAYLQYKRGNQLNLD